jgi:hypothetical protein
MPGHLYILKNSFIPNLVKIGFTERDPETRAAELSGSTGVPGKFEIVHSWLVAEAASVEERVHLELASYRRTGEFFELSPQNARTQVMDALLKWGVIGADGLSLDGRIVVEQERAKAEERRKATQHETDVEDLKNAMECIAHVIAMEECNTVIKQIQANERKFIRSLLSVFDGSIHSPDQESAITEALPLVQASIANKLIKLGLPSILHPLEKTVILQSDILFWAPSLARAEDMPENREIQYLQNLEMLLLPDSPIAMDLYHRHPIPLEYYVSLAKPYVRHRNGVLLRIPKGTTIEGSRGWQFMGRLLTNDSQDIKLTWNDRVRQFSPRGASWGNHLEDRKTFMNRQSYSQKKNLGAYDCDNLRIILGEIPE